MGALSGYGALAALQPDRHFGRVLAAYGGVFILGSLLWGTMVEASSPSARDVNGAGIYLLGTTVIIAR